MLSVDFPHRSSFIVVPGPFMMCVCVSACGTWAWKRRSHRALAPRIQEIIRGMMKQVF